MKSLRGLIRQTAFTSMAGLLLVFSLLIYVGSDVLLRHFVDNRLLEVAGAVAQLIGQHPNPLQGVGEGPGLAAELERNDNTRDAFQDVAQSLVIFSTDGLVLWRSANAATPHPNPDGTVFERVRRGNTVLETVESADGSLDRHLSFPIHQKGQVRYVLHAEASLALYQKSLEGLVMLLAAGSGMILLITWGGSGWLAKKVLTPIETLSASTESQSEAERGTQIEVDSAYQELRRLTAAFNAVMDRFRRSANSQQRFADIAAHELQTPLTVLQGNLEVTLLRARSEKEYREALFTNLEQVERLMALTRSLLTLANFTGDRPPLQLVPLALEPLARKLVDELIVLADDRQITLSLHVEPTPEILGDAQWLKQALINLLDNALRYTPSGGAVSVRLQVVGTEVTVAVEDTGHGIGLAHLPHLFERFYRTDWARTKDTGGTGLGLPIVKEIVEAHGGTITVESHLDKGSVFTLRLPIKTS